MGIVTYNSLPDLPLCLDALFAQTYPCFEVVVLDNASTDGSVQWLQARAYPIHLILNPGNVGFATAHNQIVRSRIFEPDDCYMALNPDVVLERDYIANTIAILRETGAGWATGKLRLLDRSGNRTAILYSTGHALRRDGYTINIGYGLPDTDQYDEAREVFGAPGAATLISSKLMAALGGELYDSAMFLYGEDCDLDWRARRAGWRCWYTPAALAYHRGSRANDTQRADALANRYLSVLKNAYLSDLFFYNLPLMALHCFVRLILTPRLGVQLIHKLIRLGPSFIRKRISPQLPRSTMLMWFRWSAAQETGQPRGTASRFRHFIMKHTLVARLTRYLAFTD